VDITIAPIPPESFEDYRYEVIFKAYKWDPRVGDHDTISRYACLLSGETAQELETLAEALAAETSLMERKLIDDFALAKDLWLDKPVLKALRRAQRLGGGYDPQRHVRLMRFDFHPTADGWAVSEVNSDVPGGFAESALMPGIAARFFDGYAGRANLGQSIYESFKPKLAVNRVAFVHATSYSDDRQVMQFLSDFFARQGVGGVFAALDHIKWEGKRAFCLLDNEEIGGVVRFYPVEWFPMIPKKYWEGYCGTDIPLCNHPAALLTQSKRLPLIWDRLGVDIPAWKKLLPETCDPRKMPANSEEWIYKPAMGRVGGGISIKGAVKEKELKKINKFAKRYPKEWIAQKMFKSLPLGEDKLHMCIGVFTVDGKAAGFYGRVGGYNLIDQYAADIPILVSTVKKGA
jgi:glutathionylspermidine synthase